MRSTSRAALFNNKKKKAYLKDPLYRIRIKVACQLGENDAVTETFFQCRNAIDLLVDAGLDPSILTRTHSAQFATSKEKI